eukprot:TRINITY_DN523_c1_g2_i2.p1 TRINITY_DN523_c1_g2~~TRINITY_DN523_c1_g2_i2.p1  ORF type:complete len:454 (+),score=160.64 TRINITY_DN523_c1_g2_i2:48-1364(+)
MSNDCTFLTTGPNHVVQEFYECHTCKYEVDFGVCVPCAESCHKGHDLSKKMKGTLYCDCGENAHGPLPLDALAAQYDDFDDHDFYDDDDDDEYLEDGDEGEETSLEQFQQLLMEEEQNADKVISLDHLSEQDRDIVTRFQSVSGLTDNQSDIAIEFLDMHNWDEKNAVQAYLNELFELGQQANSSVVIQFDLDTPINPDNEEEDSESSTTDSSSSSTSSKLTELDTSLQTVFLNGVSAFEKGDYPSALTSFKECVVIGESHDLQDSMFNIGVHLQVSLCYLMQHGYKSALVWIEKALGMLCDDGKVLKDAFKAQGTLQVSIALINLHATRCYVLNNDKENGEGYGLHTRALFDGLGWDTGLEGSKEYVALLKLLSKHYEGVADDDEEGKAKGMQIEEDITTRLNSLIPSSSTTSSTKDAEDSSGVSSSSSSSSSSSKE